MADIDAKESEKRQLKIATRTLLNEFENLQEAAAHCRMGATRLSQYQQFDASPFMPIDVVFELEEHVGKPIVTSKLVELLNLEWPEPEGDAVSEVMDLSPAVGDMMAFIKKATHAMSPDGIKFSEREKREYLEIRSRMDKELREVDQAVERENGIGGG